MADLLVTWHRLHGVDDRGWLVHEWPMGHAAVNLHVSTVAGLVDVRRYQIPHYAASDSAMIVPQLVWQSSWMAVNRRQQ